MKNLYLLFVLGAFLYHSQLSATIPINDLKPVSEAVAQETITITGLVVDKSTGEALPSVAVMVKGTSIGTVTDVDGKFSIKVPDRKATLVFTFVSFQKKEIVVGDKNFIRVTLEENVQMLDEAVVIGYQSVAKRKVHGSVTSIKKEDLEGITAPSIDVMLQGHVPGLNVQILSGEPGGRNTFTIRGNTEISNSDLSSMPLIVLNGIPVDPAVVGFDINSVNPFAGINPNDIESIDFLKDAAAAAIFGSKAANGVVIITTKRGKEGKPQVSFNGRFGVLTKPVTPKIVTGARERWAKLDRMQTYGSEENLGGTPQILTDSINPMFNNSTQWFDLFYKNAIVQDYNVSIAGGDLNSNYRFGAGYYNEQGTLKGTGFDRFSFNGVFQNKVGDRLEFNTNVDYSLTKRKPTPGGNASTAAIGINIADMPSSLLMLTDVDKDIMLGTYNQSVNENSQDNIKLSERIVLDIIKDRVLSFESLLSYSKSFDKSDYFEPSTANVDRKSKASSSASHSTNWTVTNNLTLNKVFGDHSFLGLLGQSAEGLVFKGNSVAGEYLPSDLIHVVQGVKQDYLSGSSWKEEATMASFFARLIYIYKDRYSISGSWRRDGSSRFGSGCKWGDFPTIAGYWIASEEPFMKGLKDKISLLKLRASWGRSGSLPSGFYGHYNRYQSTSTSYDGAAGIEPIFGDGIAQTDLSWEESKEWNFGLDLELLNGRFSFIADIYNKEKHGIFYSFDLPATIGYEKFYTNGVSVRNSGLEMMLTARILPKKSKLQWNINANASMNRNKIMKLPDGNRTVINGNKYLMVGQPLNIFRMVEYNGVFSTADQIPFDPYTGERYKSLYQAFSAGDAYYSDIDKDNVFTSYKDLKQIGDPNPKWTGGLGTNLTYGPWSLMIQSTFTLGRDIINDQLAKGLRTLSIGGVDEEGNGFSGNQANFNDPSKGTWYYHEDYMARRMLLDFGGMQFWEKEGDVTKYPSFSYYTRVENFIGDSSMFLENGAYWKLNTIMLSYSTRLPQFGINYLTLSFTAENVAILKSKNTKAADPSLVSVDGHYTGNGYGLPRRFTFGLSFNF